MTRSTPTPPPMLSLTPDSIPPPKPGPQSWEELAFRQLRLRRMAYLLVHGYSYRAIAEDLGVARTTVMRMRREVAQSFDDFSDCFVNMTLPVTARATSETENLDCTTDGDGRGMRPPEP